MLGGTHHLTKTWYADTCRQACKVKGGGLGGGLLGSILNTLTLPAVNIPNKNTTLPEIHKNPSLSPKSGMFTWRVECSHGEWKVHMKSGSSHKELKVHIESGGSLTLCRTLAALGFATPLAPSPLASVPAHPPSRAGPAPSAAAR
jgi:hypothetical protein